MRTISVLEQVRARTHMHTRKHTRTHTPQYLFFILPFSYSLSLFPAQVPLQPGQSFKFTVLETLDRIKEEFQFLQAQYHRYKLNITLYLRVEIHAVNVCG